jgi:FAD:protein FMN transferase
MIFAKRETRKNAIYRKIVLSFIALAILLGMPASIRAQGRGIKQFQRSQSVGRMPTTIFIIGWHKDGKDIEKLFDIVYSRASQAASNLDWQNPNGDVGRLNARSGQGPQTVSQETLAAFEAFKKVAAWSGGAYDATYAGEGNFRDVVVNRSGSTVELKKKGMQVRFDGIMGGFLADLMIRYIYAANMQNAMVKVGSVFRGLGNSMRGPWKIQIQDDAGTFARHALNLSVMNTGVATVSASEFRGKSIIDPRKKSAITQTCKGTVVIMRDAALAQGLANAAFILGPKGGMELLARAGNTKGLIVDNKGKFIRSPGFKRVVN